MPRNFQSGFTVIEAMVAVAVIGVLATIAIPNFQIAVKKSRQSEAKASLSSLYSAMKGFYGEFGKYDPRFDGNGYQPDGELDYRVGFAGDVPGAQLPPAIPRPGTPTCINTAVDITSCTPAGGSRPFKRWNESSTMVAQSNPYPGGFPWTAFTFPPLAAWSFKAYAVGYIGTVGKLDSWSIDNAKLIQNDTSGL